MAYQLLTVTAAPGGYDADGQLVTWNTWDSVANVDGLEFVSTGNELVLVRNTSATTAYAPTIVSVADDYGRLGNATVSIAIGAMQLFGPLRAKGWAQPNGRIRMTLANVALQVAVIRL